jgi:hypothetical protein
VPAESPDAVRCGAQEPPLEASTVLEVDELPTEVEL